MRQFQDDLKTYLHGVVADQRKGLRLTQEEMASHFYMDPRSYSDLEHGRSGFSSVSLMLLLAYLPDRVMVQVVRGFYLHILDVMDREKTENWEDPA